MPNPEDMTHSRLAPFRRRVGRFFDTQGETGTLYVDSTIESTQLGGLLWRRRWSEPFESALLFVEYPDGRFEEHHLDGDLLDKEIDAWERGEFHDGRDEVEYALTWLDEDEAARAWEAFEG